MSTRSIVGIPDGDGWKGRYIHFDGYPTGVGDDLLGLVARDGLDTVIKTMTEDNYGWSSINSTVTDATRLEKFQDDGRFKIVPGYGVAYTEVDNQSSPDEWHTYEGALVSWCEWAYILIPNGIHVFENVGAAWESRGLVAWGDTEAMKYIEMGDAA